MRLAIISLFFATAIPAFAAEPEPKAIKGEIAFVPPANPESIPAPFRLEKHTFAYEMKPKFDLPSSGVEVLTLTFPSPVKTATEANNTVHCEYFRPKTPGKHPAMIVLDILDGKQLVSRAQAMWLAQHDVAALVVYMAYYGPRRGDSKDRLLTSDIPKAVANVTQTVLDCRRAVAWLEAQPEVDAQKLGLIGTSLGSLVGGTVAGVEPKIRTVCLLLGGGGLVDAFTGHTVLAFVWPLLQLVGISKSDLTKLIDPVDPITYAEQLKGKRVLLIAASRDDVVPPKAMKNLWEAAGKPKLMWVDATHVGAALHLFQMMRAVTEFIKE
jgi:dienelactone hydrolase